MSYTKRDCAWGSRFSSHFPSPGTLDLKLCAMPAPVSRASSCSLDQLPAGTEEGEKAGTVKLVDLFKKKRVKGWWPVYNQKKGVRELTVSGRRCNV